MNPEHDALAAGVIDAELARLILGGRHELRREVGACGCRSTASPAALARAMVEPVKGDQ